jgi:beta-ketodecanoyl-[acyl-carrier-protein] synthase
VALHNAQNADAIAAGAVQPLQPSSVEFIEKASGIKSRHVVSKEGVLDPAVMHPLMAERPNEELSVLAEIGVLAAREALERAGREPGDVDAVLCAASNMQRAYPAMAIEIQHALGVDGFAFDMNVACSSATFGIQTAADFIRAGHARSVLVVNPEICSGHLNFKDRDSHFIFGDVATAILVEQADRATGESWRILGTRLKTTFSNNIRNNFGFLNRTAPGSAAAPDKLFVQEGRKVFKEVVPMVSEMIRDHMSALGLTADGLSRLWLHQANANMNRLIAERVLGREATATESPTVLDEYANTSSAGSIIAFHKHRGDLPKGARGLICSFGAGYSAGTVFVERTA